MSPESSPALGNLKTLPRIHLKATFYRMVRAEDADAILSTGPSFAYGGRYNKADEFGALYLSEAPAICEQEKLRQVANRPELLPAQVLGAIEVDIRDVLDLTDAANQRALGISFAQLTDPLDLTLPQAVAEAARALGINALLVPSAVAAGKNLVVFEDRLTQPSCKVRTVKTQKWQA
ncbi:MAG: RES family NAD+ phosphorylase [Candidatus Rokubacteria bacterium]|nr:RES family NAD+ phosphorylase [Candidatus Rokubacteria bacterium]